MAKDVNKEKFRPQDEALEREVDQALGDLSLEDLYGFDKPQPAGSEAGAAAGAGAGQQGGMRKGRVVSVSQEDVFVDFGGKSQGIASLVQFEEIPSVGDEIEFHVERYDPREGLLILTRKGATAANVSWENVQEGQVVEGTVTGSNKGGLELQVKNMRGFMPAGQIDLYHVPDLEQFTGQKMTAEVTQVDHERRNLVLSRRNILEREREQARQKLMEELEEGQIRRGTVRKVMDFGAFVDLGGVDGLLHVSEMALRRVRHPNEIVNEGDVVDVKVTRIDRETGKLSLSLKQTMADPWLDAETKYAPGTQVTGRVTRVESFGAFIEIEEGIEGLLPVSEMSWQRIRHPSDVVKEGDTIGLVVLSLDVAQKRLSFSLKQAGPDPWTRVNERFATDMVVSGRVTRIVDFGAFVELEPGLEGLVHISELSPQRVRSAADVVKVGQEVQVRILEIDQENRRMSLSLKRAEGAGEGASAAAAVVDGKESEKKKQKRAQLRGGLDF
jgi:small subunit ribosomal protein S1